MLPHVLMIGSSTNKQNYWVEERRAYPTIGKK